MTTSTPQPESHDLTGRTLAEYRVLRRLGRGAMAEVYLAEQQSLRRPVALKVLSPHLVNDATYVRRFQLEAQSAAALVHANIVQIYDVGCAEGIHYIAQEYIRGQNLRDFLERHGSPPLAMAVAIIRQVAAALDKAATAGIVHRDIKPENILLAPGGEVKVADFGLARPADPAQGVNLTQVGVTLGTPLYMSPEQVEGRPLDSRSDIYSLGVTCYCMLAGRPPFEGDTALSVAVAHLNQTPTDLSSLRADLSPILCALVMKMLAKDPAGRYQSPREILQELRSLAPEQIPDEQWAELVNTPVEREASEGFSPTEQLSRLMRTEQPPPRPSGRAVPWALVSGVLIAAGIGAALAAVNRPAWLLSPAAGSEVGVERADTARDQYVLATFLGTEGAYKAVEQYFPQDRYFSLRATQQLARLHLQQDDYARALEQFARLSGDLEAEPEFRAYGTAGEFVVFTLTDRPSQAVESLQRLMPLEEHLRDDQLRQLVGVAWRRQRERTNAADRTNWDAWMNERFAEQGG